MSPETSSERRTAVKLTLGLCAVLWLGLALWLVMSDRIRLEQSSLQNEQARAESSGRVISSPTTDSRAVVLQGDVADAEQVDVMGSESTVTPRVAGGDVDNSIQARRDADIAAVASLAEGLRFAIGQDELTDQPRERLDLIFETLFLYPDTAVEFVIAGNEVDGAERDRELGELRAGAILDYLEARGIERERLAMRVGDSDGLPSGSHRVRVQVDDAHP